MSNETVFTIKCGWGDTRARLVYLVDGVYHWEAVKDKFRFITHDLEDVKELQ